MSRPEFGSELLAKVVKKAIETIPDGQLPIIFVPSFGKRTDLSTNPLTVLINEYHSYPSSLLPKITYINNVVALAMPPASPHTPMVNQLGDHYYPAHLNIWWGELNNPNQITILDLARMSKEQRQFYIQAITDQIQKGVLFLGNQVEDLVNLDPNQWHHFLEIYGLCGYATPQERRQYGLSRGAQSHPSGHLNIAYHPYERYSELAQVKTVTPREIIKHIGPMDTAIFHWEHFFRQIIGQILIKRNRQCQVNDEKHHGKRLDNKLVKFYEGIAISYDQPGITLDEALNDLCDIISIFDKFYQILKNGYEQYFLTRNDNKQQIKQQTINNLFNFIYSIDDQCVLPIESTQKTLEEIFDFSVSFMPTYQQIINWLNDPDISQPTKEYLERKKTQYEKFRLEFEEISKLEKPGAELSGEERNRLLAKKSNIIRIIRHLYRLTNDLEAEIFLQFFIDMVQPGENWRQIEYTWPLNLSLSYLFDQYVFDEDGNIFVAKMTLAPRFFTSKGAVEDLAGVVIKREQGV